MSITVKAVTCKPIPLPLPRPPLLLSFLPLFLFNPPFPPSSLPFPSLPLLLSFPPRFNFGHPSLFHSIPFHFISFNKLFLYFHIPNTYYFFSNFVFYLLVYSAIQSLLLFNLYFICFPFFLFFSFLPTLPHIGRMRRPWSSRTRTEFSFCFFFQFLLFHSTAIRFLPCFQFVKLSNA